MYLQDLIAGRYRQVEIPESLINTILHERGLCYTVQVCNNSMMITADTFQAEFAYLSHDFDNAPRVIHFTLHRIKPFYYAYGLQLLHKKFPFLEYQKDADGGRIIACNVDKIPGISEIAHKIKLIDIESVACEKGKIIVGLRAKPGGTEGDERHV
jgi:hypothetical protein